MREPNTLAVIKVLVLEHTAGGNGRGYQPGFVEAPCRRGFIRAMAEIRQCCCFMRCIAASRAPQLENQTAAAIIARINPRLQGASGMFSSALEFDQTPAGHFLRHGLTHQGEHGGGDVAQAAVFNHLGPHKSVETCLLLRPCCEIRRVCVAYVKCAES
jgi:hypothetical protein